MKDTERLKLKRKLENLALLSFKNALRLHNDSLVLFKEKSFSSAYFISVLALEELGKVNLLNSDHIWEALNYGGRDAVLSSLKITYDHKVKQKAAFEWTSFYKKNKDRGNFEEIKKLKSVLEGKFDIEKQKSMYAGFEKINGKIDLFARIHNPMKMGKDKIEKQLALVHEILLKLIIKCLKGIYSWDYEKLNIFIFDYGEDIYTNLINQPIKLSIQCKRDLCKLKKLGNIVDLIRRIP